MKVNTAGSDSSFGKHLRVLSYYNLAKEEQMRRFFVVTAILAAGLLALPAFSQQRVKIGPNGVEVDTGATKVKAGGDGAQVSAPGVDVEADESGAHVKAPGVEVDADETGVEIKTPGSGVKAGGNTGNTGAGTRHTLVVPKGYKQHAPIVCQGNQERTYSHVYLKCRNDCVLVQGNCDITIKDSHLEAGRHGVLLQGNGDIKLVRTYVEGHASAISISGNGDVSASGCTIVGGVKTSGNGDFEDEGKNSFRQR